jgi:hypothetical protein
LPQAQIARGPGIIGNVRVLSEELLASSENVNAGKEYNDQANSEKSAQNRRRIFELVNRRDKIGSH